MSTLNIVIDSSGAISAADPATRNALSKAAGRYRTHVVGGLIAMTLDEGTGAVAREGEVLLRNRYLSLDPYMRGRMNDAKSYAAPQPLGEVMQGGTVGEVLGTLYGGGDTDELAGGRPLVHPAVVVGVARQRLGRLAFHRHRHRTSTAFGASAAFLLGVEDARPLEAGDTERPVDDATHDATGHGGAGRPGGAAVGDLRPG